MGELFKRNVFGVVKCILMMIMLFFHILYAVWAGMGILIMITFLGIVIIQIIQKFVIKETTEDKSNFDKLMDFLLIPFCLLLILDYSVYITPGALLLVLVLNIMLFYFVDGVLTLLKVPVKKSKTVGILTLIKNIAEKVGVAFSFLICTAFVAPRPDLNSMTWDQLVNLRPDSYNLWGPPSSLRIAFSVLSMIPLLIAITLATIVLILYIVENKENFKAYMEKQKAEAAEQNNAIKEKKLVAQQAAMAAAVAQQAAMQAQLAQATEAQEAKAEEAEVEEAEEIEENDVSTESSVEESKVAEPVEEAEVETQEVSDEGSSEEPEE